MSKAPERIWLNKQGRIAHTQHQQVTEYIRKDLAGEEYASMIRQAHRDTLVTRETFKRDQRL